jgi:hypothetical protein
MSSSRRGGTKFLNCVGATGKETRANWARLTIEAKGDARYGGVSPFYLTPQKHYQQNILHRILLAPEHACSFAHMNCMCINAIRGPTQEAPRGAQDI